MSDFRITKSYEEINDKIKKGTAVVVTAEEMPGIVEKEGLKNAAKKVDVVTTGTCGTMCSSGAFLNVYHTKPKMKISKMWLNDVEAYSGIAAVDCYIGAAQVKEDDPLNRIHPGSFKYGGGHVIEDLIAGRQVRLKAAAYGTDEYPRKELEKVITINDLRNAFLYNPRNAYQNYNCAVNGSDKTIYTYMGILHPGMANATYSSAGELSPLLNDPFFHTIGTGTRIFVGGAPGAVTWYGTQHTPDPARTANGVPIEGSGTIAVTGDMKLMNSRYVRGASITGYGCSLMMGIGIPLPILNEEMAYYTSVRNRDIFCNVIDYGLDYPEAKEKPLASVSYGELMTGTVNINGKKIPASPLSSVYIAREIAETLKEWVRNGFTLGIPQLPIPTVPFTPDIPEK